MFNFLLFLLHFPLATAAEPGGSGIAAAVEECAENRLPAFLHCADCRDAENRGRRILRQFCFCKSAARSR